MKFKLAVRAIYLLLRKAPVVSPHTLIGINHLSGAGGTWTNAPIFQTSPVFDALRSLGVKEMDSQHLMAAIDSKCAAFLTFDGGVIHRAKDIKAKYEIVCSRPSSFAP
jgi:hypothetical protein